MIRVGFTLSQFKPFNFDHVCFELTKERNEVLFSIRAFPYRKIFKILVAVKEPPSHAAPFSHVEKAGKNF